MKVMAMIRVVILGLDRSEVTPLEMEASVVEGGSPPL